MARQVEHRLHTLPRYQIGALKRCFEGYIEGCSWAEPSGRHADGNEIDPRHLFIAKDCLPDRTEGVVLSRLEHEVILPGSRRR